MAGLLTLFVSATLVVWLNASVAPGAFQLASSGEPLLDGFRATFGSGLAKVLALVACVGLISSFHTILFAKGRQIYSLSRAGYFPRFLSITHPRHKTPHVALIAGSVVALTLMLGLWFGMGAEKGAAVIQGMLLNMAVAGAMLSYLLQAVSFLVLRARLPSLTRPYRSPMGVGGAIVTIAIAAVTLVYQLLDPVFVSGVLGVCAWFALGILWFALVGRNRLVLSPEEAFALKTRESQPKRRQSVSETISLRFTVAFGDALGDLLAELIEVRTTQLGPLQLGMRDGIHRLAFARQLEVKVCAGRTTGAADEADHIALRHHHARAVGPGANPARWP